MRRLALLLLAASAMLSTGCIAAVPLLIYAHKNRHASAVEVKPATAPDAVRLVTHVEPTLTQPGFVAR